MAGALRIDKWLFHARFCKTRALAQEKARTGQIRLNGQPVEKPHTPVKPGDILTLPSGGSVFILKIRDLGERRGRFSEAQALYERMD